jgi:ElaB/YqjD/DUF883 family membrane-anchored ribosome-binding protein
MAKTRSSAGGASTTADEIEAIEELMSDLEARLRRLQSSVRREAAGASSDVSSFVTEALTDIAARVRDGTTNVGQHIGGDAAKLAPEMLKKVTDEVEQRPLLVLAIAAGIGFVLGLLQQR